MLVFALLVGVALLALSVIDSHVMPKAVTMDQLIAQPTSKPTSGPTEAGQEKSDAESP